MVIESPVDDVWVTPPRLTMWRVGEIFRSTRNEETARQGKTLVLNTMERRDSEDTPMASSNRGP